VLAVMVLVTVSPSSIYHNKVYTSLVKVPSFLIPIYDIVP
jgi:hypothetical protein